MPTYRVTQYTTQSQVLYVRAPDEDRVREYLNGLEDDGKFHDSSTHDVEYHIKETDFASDIVDVVLPNEDDGALDLDARGHVRHLCDAGYIVVCFSPEELEDLDGDAKASLVDYLISKGNEFINQNTDPEE